MKPFANIDLRAPLAEDNMNVQLKDITVTARDGRVSHLDQVYIRGSHVRFFIVPDMLKYVSVEAKIFPLYAIARYLFPQACPLTSHGCDGSC